MPTSDREGKDVAAAWITGLAPATVWDIGAGEGTYRRLVPGVGRHWTAVEAWGPYVTAYALDQLYDRVIVADIRYLDPRLLRDVDLVICGDVLEHMDAAAATTLIRQVTDAARHLLISVPVLHLEQGAVNGNPFERHVQHYDAAAMHDLLAPGLIAEHVGNVLGYFLWSADAARHRD